MTEVTIMVPDKISLALKVSAQDLGHQVLLAAAVKLYEMRKLSSGAAAELAGIPKPLFLMKLAEYDVDTFDLTEEDFASSISFSNRSARFAAEALWAYHGCGGGSLRAGGRAETWNFIA
jgi:predicted HTH domain antitoxin